MKEDRVNDIDDHADVLKEAGSSLVSRVSTDSNLVSRVSTDSSNSNGSAANNAKIMRFKDFNEYFFCLFESRYLVKEIVTNSNIIYFPALGL